LIWILASILEVKLMLRVADMDTEMAKVSSERKAACDGSPVPKRIPQLMKQKYSP